MCGRFGLWASPGQVADHFQLQSQLPLMPRYNIAPSQEILAVGQDREGRRKAASLRWGLIPKWATDTGMGYKLINARAESVFSKPTFRSAAKKRRCLIPASCFFEWKPSGEGPKQPYCILPRQSEVFAFAGLWETWENGATGQKIHSCSIVTTRANEAVQPLHERMPVLVAPENYDLWLDRNIQDLEAVKRLLEPPPSDWLEICKVGTEVNNPANDTQEIIRPCKE